MENEPGVVMNVISLYEGELNAHCSLLLRYAMLMSPCTVTIVVRQAGISLSCHILTHWNLLIIILLKSQFIFQLLIWVEALQIHCQLHLHAEFEYIRLFCLVSGCFRYSDWKVRSFSFSPFS